MLPQLPVNLRRLPYFGFTFPITAVLHPDQDHYKGFCSLIKSAQFQFDTVFLKSLVERTGADTLGHS